MPAQTRRDVAAHCAVLTAIPRVEYVDNTRNGSFPKWMTERLNDGIYLGEWARIGLYAAIAFVEKYLLLGGFRGKGK